MKTLTLTASLALAQLLAGAAYAQPATAEAVPPGTTLPAPKPKATAAEKAEGKASRKVAGKSAAKEDTHSEGNPVPDAKAKVAKDERQAARATRKAETTRANKAGEITAKGETGVAK